VSQNTSAPIVSTPAMPTPTPIPTDVPVERLEEFVVVGEVELTVMEVDNDELSVVGLGVAVDDELVEIEDVDIVLEYEYVVSWKGVSGQGLRSCNPLFGDKPILRRIYYQKAT
jgi:hypothetical protein